MQDPVLEVLRRAFEALDATELEDALVDLLDACRRHGA